MSTEGDSRLGEFAPPRPRAHQSAPICLGLAVIACCVVVGCVPRPPAASTPSGTPTEPATVSPSPEPLTATASRTSAPPTPTATTPPRAVTAFPDPSEYVWREIVSGLESPTDIQFVHDGSGRMFVTEQRGRIRIVEQEQLLPSPFLELTDRVDSAGYEQGLLGLAFAPDYAENRRFFVDYTDNSNHDVISRFEVSADPGVADPATETRLINVNDPFSNHNGGVLAFGPDGYLYAGLGDGGGAGDVLGNGQNTGTLLGSIMRFDVHGGDPFAIPPDNPFIEAGGRPEIWAYGLRNPWRLSFDQATGDLYIADVGQNAWEEIDFLPAGSAGGANFGWNYREGLHPFAGTPPPGIDLIDPVAEYSHAEGGCSVTGGFVYRGAITAWQGVYLYGDYCSGKIWGLIHADRGTSPDQWQSALLFETHANITTFGQDQAGEVYFASRSGAIYRLEQAP